MRGQVLQFDAARGEGIVNAEDGKSYSFTGADWKGAPNQLQPGLQIDFSPAGANAVSLYPTDAPGMGAGSYGSPTGGYGNSGGGIGGSGGSYQGGAYGNQGHGAPGGFGAPGGHYGGHPGHGAYASEKSPIAAGLLALFLGGLGIHKFYLGYNQEGIILLVATMISWVLTIILIGFLGLMAISVVCIIEAIIYLTKPQHEFTRIYVQGRRPWF
jgi:TM2 domain-containing membrane protein YozV